MSSYPPPPGWQPPQGGAPDDHERRSGFPQPVYPTYPKPPTQPQDTGYNPPGYQPPGPPGRQRRRGGVLGGLAALLTAILAYGKWILLFAFKLPLFATLISLAVSFGLYAAFWGPWFAAGLVVMIFVHEMGHVMEIRRQGMRATAPVFIPFFGAAIFQRQHATDALHQAEIGIAGPIAGTIGATVAWVAYGATHQPVLLLWAYLGFIINLFNLIPLGMLDGGWVLSVASKWFQLFGAALLVLAAVFLGFSPLVLIIAVLSIPAIIDRFRNDRLPYYRAVPTAARWGMGVAWLALVAYLGFATLESHTILTALRGA